MKITTYSYVSHNQRVSIILIASIFILLLRFILIHPYSNTSSNDINLDGNPVYVPKFEDHKLINSERTLFLLPGKENKCHYQYDYVCKFWFYIRCFVYGTFPNVKMLSLGPRSVFEFIQEARDGDIAIVIWRSKNHSEIPENLLSLLQWRHQSSSHQLKSKTARVKIGVFHIANEVNRTDWPWYPLPDFIIRNYWISNMPPQVTFVPLGHQMPNICQPWSTVTSVFDRKTNNVCNCEGYRYKRSSDRAYVWNFSGSLRKKRALLLKSLKRSLTLKDRGYIQVSKKFGGDGIFGSLDSNPKTDYLKSIQDSQFVFAPCGNAMETHRIYEALSLGAIPIIENCDPTVSHFFPFRELIIDGGPEEMLKFVEGYLDQSERIDDLQARVMDWWNSYSDNIGANVSQTIHQHIAPSMRTAL